AEPVEAAPSPGHPSHPETEQSDQAEGEAHRVIAGKDRAHEAAGRLALKGREGGGSGDEGEEANGSEPDRHRGQSQLPHGVTIGAYLSGGGTSLQVDTRRSDS